MKKVLDPIRPIIDVLTARIPVLSDIGLLRDLLDYDDNGRVTLLELGKALGVADTDFIQVAADVLELIDMFLTPVVARTSESTWASSTLGRSTRESPRLAELKPAE